MERTKEQWRDWFGVSMLLNGHGFIPGNPRTRGICGRKEVLDRWGPAVELTEGIGAPCRGYEFREEDGEPYHLYVIELFQRVHQRKLLRRVLPYHFARGLAVEASGGAVNWVAFAMSRCFPRHKKSAFVPLSEYAAYDVPVPWIHEKVFPAVVHDAPRPKAPESQVCFLGNSCRCKYHLNLPKLWVVATTSLLFHITAHLWKTFGFNLKGSIRNRNCAGGHTDCRT